MADMMTLIVYSLAFIGSLAIVLKGADIFCNNLVSLGKSIGISEIVLGCTVSAAGTSLPEFGSAMISVFNGNPDIGVGTVIGSNVWNIAGILGITALVAGVVRTNKEELKRDGLMCLITALILFGFMLVSNSLTAIMGIVLVSAYLIYLWRLIKTQQKHSTTLHVGNPQEGKGNLMHVLENEDSTKKRSTKKSILMVIIGLLSLIAGAEVLVWGAVGIAHAANISEMIIGLTILSIGTSLPELFVTLTSILKKRYSLGFGNILGSNIFNILMGLGIPALVLPIPIERLSVNLDAPVLIGITSLLLLLCINKNKEFKRYGGLILVIAYISYICLRLFVFV